MSIYSHSETQMVKFFLLQVYVWELHNSMESPPEEDGITEARDTESNIIISDSNLSKILPPQLKKI